MKKTLLASVLLPVLLFAAMPAHAATPFDLRVSNITVVKVPPTCEIRATKKRMTSGSTMEIVWDSKNATKAYGLTRDARTWDTEGRQRFAIAFVGKHEFPMTFEGPGGKTTCTAKVFVKAKRTR